MKNVLQVVCVVMSLFFGIPTGMAAQGLNVFYDEPQNDEEAIIRSQIKTPGIVDEFATFINEQYLLPQSLSVRFGGDDGPLYDLDSNEIIIPYSFIQEVQSRFESANYVETGRSLTDATIDVVMHTLLHEFAHAIIATCQLPIVGKEEDAADSLASVLLIEFFEDGSESVISAADLFDIESGDRDVFEEEDFWDEHSLDDQRFYSTLCHVYGSDPEGYSYLKTDAGFSEERAELCVEEYEGLVRSWSLLLEPYVR